MKKFGAILFLVTVLMQLPAMAEEPVRVRSDGKIVDKEGNITAVPNATDPRNNDTQKYYTALDAEGRSTGTSNFYLVSDPDKGLIRKELNKPVLPVAETPKELDFTPRKTTGKTGAQPVMVNAPPSSSDGTVYGNVREGKTVYGQ